MKHQGEIPHPPRRNRVMREQVHDPYKARLKLPEPTVCPDCGAVFHEGRWCWAARPAAAHEELCQACRRARDRYPAGELTITGDFVSTHKKRSCISCATRKSRRRRSTRCTAL